MISRPIRRGGLAAAAMTLLLVGPAAAHPFFDPEEVPVDSLAELTLDLAHGCGDDQDADDGGGEDGEPTRQVAIEVPDAVTWVDPVDADGWDLEVEGGDGSREDDAEVIVYTARAGTDEPAPRFDLEAVHVGEVGDEVHWRIMQACDEATHRWVGTEEEPAADPAVTVTLAEADPAAPPPEEAAQGDPGDEEPTGPADEPEAEEPAEEPGPDEPAPEPDADLEGGEAGDDGGDALLPGWALVVVLVATLGVAGLVLLLRDRGTGDDGATPQGRVR